MKKYSLLAAMCVSLLLMGCGSDSVYDDYNRNGLLSRINSAYESENYSASREAAESFIARFPQDEQIDLVRIKLLASYIHSSHYIMAAAYADRLLEGALLDEVYYEDVEYYKLILTIEKSKHNYAGLFRVKDIYRNFTELETVLNRMDAFEELYPNSAYLEELQERREELRHVLAKHQLEVAYHYAQKGNQEAALQRLELYESRYGDIKHPLKAKIEDYLDR